MGDASKIQVVQSNSRAYFSMHNLRDFGHFLPVEMEFHLCAVHAFAYMFILNGLILTRISGLFARSSLLNHGVRGLQRNGIPIA